MQCYTLLTYETAHTQNISPMRLHMKDGLIKNQTSHICENSELLSGSFYKDRKSHGKCYRNQYAEFMLAMMMARAVKYYNAETHRILTSRNFRHITPPDNP